MAGGSILQGVLKLGDSIEVRPGIVTKVCREAEMHGGTTVCCLLACFRFDFRLSVLSVCLSAATNN